MSLGFYPVRSSRKPAEAPRLDACIPLVLNASLWNLLLGGCLCTLAGCSASGVAGAPEPSASPLWESGSSGGSPEGTLMLSRRILDFGIVPQGGQHHQYFELMNPTSTRVEVNRVETSCDCLAITLAEHSFPPGGKVLACARLDLSRAAHFAGRLQIEVRGMTSAGETALEVTLDADVRLAEEFGGLITDLPAITLDRSDPNPTPTSMSRRGG